MAIYDNVSKKQLEEKFDYELWLLNFLSNEEIFYSEGSVDTVYFKNNEFLSNRDVSLSARIGGDRVARNLLYEIIPLTFVSTYKILDMIFEWILEMNNETPKSKFWTFTDKINRINKLDSKLNYPPFFQSNIDIKDHLFQLYKNLKESRNEIVHKHNFKIIKKDNPELQIISNDGKIIINKDQMRYFVAIVVSTAKILIDKVKFEEKEIIHYKYYLDQIHNLHKFDLFKIKKPIIINVMWIFDLKGNKYKANLDFIRKSLQKYKDYKERDIRFNLWIAGLEKSKVIRAWKFPVDDINHIGSSYLNLKEYDDISISIDELDEFITLKKILSFYNSN